MYGPILLKCKAQRLRKETSNEKTYHTHENMKLDAKAMATKALLEALVDTCHGTCGHASSVFALPYITLEVFPIVFEEQRGYSLVVGSLLFNRLSATSVFFCGKRMDQISRRHPRKIKVQTVHAERRGVRGLGLNPRAFCLRCRCGHRIKGARAFVFGQMLRPVREGSALGVVRGYMFLGSLRMHAGRATGLSQKCISVWQPHFRHNKAPNRPGWEEPHCVWTV